VGTVFEVYTSSGVNTNFTNACGDYFKMGYEEGEAYYTLAASESSCAP
jgi:propanediol dehydratase large subunit